MGWGCGWDAGTDSQWVGVGRLDTHGSMVVVGTLDTVYECADSRRASQPQPTNQSVLFSFEVCPGEDSVRYFDIELYVFKDELGVCFFA